MGRGVATYLTAVGDTVNTTSRLQDQTEQFQCQLIVSAPMAHHAGLDVSGYRHAQVSVRNRTEAIDIVIIPTVDDL